LRASERQIAERSNPAKARLGTGLLWHYAPHMADSKYKFRANGTVSCLKSEFTASILFKPV
jgi:hypothetical protein